MALIHTEDLSKHFKILNRRQGLAGSVRDLFSRDYRTVRAVDGVSFDIEPGEIVGYIGPNGAGKSTTIKMMTGILKPTSGTILVNGQVPYENRIRQARTMGVVFGQRSQLWWELPVIESFRILKEIYGVDQQSFDKQMAMFDSLVGIGELYSQQVRTLSLGQRMLCDITAAFLHNPSVVFLDEPTIGLDVSIKAKIRSLIEELNRAHNTTIILTTHDLGDVEALSRRLIIIDKGTILYDGSTEKVSDLVGSYRTLKVQLSQQDGGNLNDGVRDRFGEDDGVSVQPEEDGWTAITIDQGRVPLSDVLNHVMTTSQVADVRIEEISMESVVKRIYDGALR